MRQKSTKREAVDNLMKSYNNNFYSPNTNDKGDQTLIKQALQIFVI